jgi:myo-inositol-1(or 4)-monophosphatase
MLGKRQLDMDILNASGTARSKLLLRIEEALNAAALSISPFLVETPRIEFKSDKNPVTEADRTVNRVLRDALLQGDEGWLSEESVDDLTRLGRKHLWVVDPIDGTSEFISGIPEWCISVAFVEDGHSVAGGICNPVTHEVFLGSLDDGVQFNGTSVKARQCQGLRGALVLASRSEIARGEWECYRNAPFVTRPMGSIAYKLALIAAGMADATWTRTPKHEWDIAAGSALVRAAGGFIRGLDDSELNFNNASPVLTGLLACGPHLDLELNSWLRAEHSKLSRSA